MCDEINPELSAECTTLLRFVNKQKRPIFKSNKFNPISTRRGRLSPPIGFASPKIFSDDAPEDYTCLYSLGVHCTALWFQKSLSSISANRTKSLISAGTIMEH